MLQGIVQAMQHLIVTITLGLPLVLESRRKKVKVNADLLNSY